MRRISFERLIPAAQDFFNAPDVIREPYETGRKETKDGEYLMKPDHTYQDRTSRYGKGEPTINAARFTDSQCHAGTLNSLWACNRRRRVR